MDITITRHKNRPPDIILWGLMKNNVYMIKTKTSPNLKQTISDTFYGSNVEVWNITVTDNVRCCIEHEVVHFEHVK